MALTRNTLQVLHGLLMQASVAAGAPDFEKNATLLIKAKKEVEGELGIEPAEPAKPQRSRPNYKAAKRRKK